MHLSTKVAAIIYNIGLQAVAHTHHQNVGDITAVTLVDWHSNTQYDIIIVIVLQGTLDGLEGIEHAIGLGHRHKGLRQIVRVEGSRSAVGTGLAGIVATAVGADSVVPHQSILIAYQLPMVVVLVDEFSLAGIEPAVEQAVVVRQVVDIVVDGECLWQYQFHMVEQISACLTLCRDTTITVADLQQGIGGKLVACGPPDAKVINHNLWRIDRSAVTHIDDLITCGTALEHQRGALGVTPVVDTAAFCERQFVGNIQIGGILQREVVATDLLQPGTATIDEFALLAALIGGTCHRGRRLHILAKDITVVKATTLDTDGITTDDACIIIIGVAACVILQRSLANDLSARKDIDLACWATG